jgi:hypothetical protein
MRPQLYSTCTLLYGSLDNAKAEIKCSILLSTSTVTDRRIASLSKLLSQEDLKQGSAIGCEKCMLLLRGMRMVVVRGKKRHRVRQLPECPNLKKELQAGHEVGCFKCGRALEGPTCTLPHNDKDTMCT